jgi:hypothetical protein
MAVLCSLFGLIFGLGAWTFMWFVCFCYLADQWNKADKDTVNPDGASTSGVEAAIAFSFFSIASFVSRLLLLLCSS